MSAIEYAEVALRAPAREHPSKQLNYAYPHALWVALRPHCGSLAGDR